MQIGRQVNLRLIINSTKFGRLKVFAVHEGKIANLLTELQQYDTTIVTQPIISHLVHLAVQEEEDYPATLNQEKALGSSFEDQLEKVSGALDFKRRNIDGSVIESPDKLSKYLLKKSNEYTRVFISPPKKLTKTETGPRTFDKLLRQPSTRELRAVRTKEGTNERGKKTTYHASVSQTHFLKMKEEIAERTEMFIKFCSESFKMDKLDTDDFKRQNKKKMNF